MKRKAVVDYGIDYGLHNMHGTAGLYYVSNPVSCIIIYDKIKSVRTRPAGPPKGREFSFAARFDQSICFQRSRWQRQRCATGPRLHWCTCTCTYVWRRCVRGVLLSLVLAQLELRPYCSPATPGNPLRGACSSVTAAFITASGVLVR